MKGKDSKFKFYQADLDTALKLPLFKGGLKAGFPSPATGNKGWDFDKNPIRYLKDDGRRNNKGEYVDYKDADVMKLVNQLKIKPGFMDYTMGGFNLIGAGARGLYNRNQFEYY